MVTQIDAKPSDQKLDQRVHRRSVLQWGIAAASTGALTVTAGCTGSSPGNNGPDLQIADRNAEITTFGDVVATVTVVNEGDESGTGEVWVEVELDAGETYSESKVVRVGPDETQTYEIDIDIGTVDALASSEAQIDIWLEA